MKKIVFLSMVLLTIGFSQDLVDLGFDAYDKGDYNKAAKIFSRTCDNKVIDGCLNLGYLYMDGLGVRQDYHKVVKLLKKACDGGNVQSCSILGSLYIQGLGLSRDYYDAKEYFGKAYDLGDQKGCDF